MKSHIHPKKKPGNFSRWLCLLTPIPKKSSVSPQQVSTKVPTGQISETRVVENPAHRVKWLMDIPNQVDRLVFFHEENVWENVGNHGKVLCLFLLGSILMLKITTKHLSS